MVTVIAIMLPIALITGIVEGFEYIWDKIQDHRAVIFRSEARWYV